MITNNFLKSNLLNSIKVRNNSTIKISNQDNNKKEIKLAKKVKININYTTQNQYKISNN